MGGTGVSVPPPVPTKPSFRYNDAMFPPLPLEPARTHALDVLKELDSGQTPFSPQDNLMFGVLVCREPDSQRQVVLRAFSGQFRGGWLVEGWVPPLLDVTAYDGQVQRDDGEIQSLTGEIKALEGRLCAMAAEASLPAAEVSALESRLQSLRIRRRRLSHQSLSAISSLYRFPCADGIARGFADFYPGFQEGRLPPTGTGDCCAPKLLGEAFRRGLVPVSLAEFFYGDRNQNCCCQAGTEGRRHREFYPPCDEKCGLVLPTMLGLEILYRDDSIVVVNKPAGLLSVPGRGTENQDCVVARLKRLFPQCIHQPSVHRLDQDTSGLLVLALTQDAHRHLSRQFMEGTVYKEYEALLRGRVVSSGWNHLELPFRLDVDNRPRQMYDETHGKVGITHWKVLSHHRCGAAVCRDKVLTRILFVPRTGRTHQLRLHAMHQKGIGIPIQGDRLYGQRLEGERLMLHATRLRFIHPEKNEPVECISPAPF